MESRHERNVLFRGWFLVERHETQYQKYSRYNQETQFTAQGERNTVSVVERRANTRRWVLVGMHETQ